MTDRHPLFVFEMANNHMGDVSHGLRIIKELKAISDNFLSPLRSNFSTGILDTCIHPDYRNCKELKVYQEVYRNGSDVGAIQDLKDAIVDAGFLSMCTPWDEVSVDKIVEHGFDYMKFLAAT